METTIQVSTDLVQTLKNMKMFDKESYEEVIWDLVEDHMELSEATKKNIAQAEKEIRDGKTITLEEYKKKLKMRNV